MKSYATKKLAKNLLALLVVLAAVATACGSDAQDTTAPIPTTVPTSAQTEPTAAPATTEPVATQEPEPLATTAPTTPDPSATPAPSPSQTPAQPTPLPTSRPDLQGAPFDFLVPEFGEPLAVVGVAFDDTLEVHLGPGENTPLVATLGPTATDVRSAGEGRQLSQSIWWRVTQGSTHGWVGSRFMSRLGVTVDLTSQVVGDSGTTFAAETMLDLGMLVAAERASIDPPSSIVVSVAPSVGDLGEITIDVVGFPDDAVQGERLHIFGQPLESGEGFSLKSVEAQIMCRRGVTSTGLCL